MIKRRKTREVKIGNLIIGGEHSVTVQSITVDLKANSSIFLQRHVLYLLNFKYFFLFLSKINNFFLLFNKFLASFSPTFPNPIKPIVSFLIN